MLFLSENIQVIFWRPRPPKSFLQTYTFCDEANGMTSPREGFLRKIVRRVGAGGTAAALRRTRA